MYSEFCRGSVFLDCVLWNLSASCGLLPSCDHASTDQRESSSMCVSMYVCIPSHVYLVGCACHPVCYVCSREFFDMFATLAETFVFLYMGLAIFTLDHEYHAGLIFMSLVRPSLLTTSTWSQIQHRSTHTHHTLTVLLT
eukprot:GFYU01023104.1.p1 GENE.GFYU01023104.1~~GFYU01023104.1.p1  ORF type:complete len:139 (+),score=8.05 GFYU01023104.1:365-781(+)